MLARRLPGFITALLMLHLTFVGADLACAQHGDRPTQGHQHAMRHQQHRGAAVHVEAATGNQPCDTPTQPACCQAMTSCAINATCERVDRSASVPPCPNVIAPAVTRIPSSPITAPDPPPPKA